MYTCINCGVEVEELYRRYSPSVLKVLKCTKCGSLADKYIEYDPVIVLVDLVLLEKPAYRHLLYNSGFQAYWKLMVVLLLSESFRVWSTYDRENEGGSVAHLDRLKNDIFDGERSFYILLAQTGLSLGAFVCAVTIGTEIRWMILNRRPHKYKASDLVRALTVGGCAKLLGLLGLVWEHVAHDPHYALIHGYTMLCLLTAYSVVCESGRGGSLIGLAGGFLAHDYVSNSVSWLLQATPNITLIQNGT
ncbi:protein ARV1 [Venturia canescens]|uniref:protein ARV1 n=1 Tax=Venturia canescens TaxID=32260 RepID=UPI001C9BFDA3|nr:protein ARV1 [Venturia canescens]XP_043273703.1 protein ARV1 [Venturia canescens]XP_043273704.1 protein ARV1 [Venturia canescens]XP_043273705.1 protein ARV1 [Venturia canescens]